MKTHVQAVSVVELCELPASDFKDLLVSRPGLLVLVREVRERAVRARVHGMHVHGFADGMYFMSVISSPQL